MNLVSRDGVLVGFRPEHLLPVDAVTTGDRVRLKLAVDRMEYLSGDRHLYGRVSGIGQETRVVARLPATVTSPITAGEGYDFAVPRDRLRFFDAATGRRTGPVPL
jgi:multiple sugar transport system ATP-binding protein